ncbi:hypothetical protein NL676_029468 [Syzygium grande]|nr:hypothetical protein NL676_029468 [Syzygium grande]
MLPASVFELSAVNSEANLFSSWKYQLFVFTLPRNKISSYIMSFYLKLPSHVAFFLQGVPEQKLQAHLFSFGGIGNLALQPMWSENRSCILLDEPSNHLDFDAVEALIQGLVLFQGGILMDVDGSVLFFWGSDSEGNLVLSNDAEVVKKGCGKSFAPFPQELQENVTLLGNNILEDLQEHASLLALEVLRRYEHPLDKVKPVPRVDNLAKCEA